MTTIYITDPAVLPRRRDDELYPTERSLIKAALEAYTPPLGVGSLVLDPGAGDGRWGQGVKALYPETGLHGVELRRVGRPAGFDYWADNQNFLSFPALYPYNLIPGNPPYGPKVDSGRVDERGRRVLVPLAEHFIRRGFDLLAPGGRMIYLLPLQLQAGKDRRENLWITHAPVMVAVVSRRPSFGKNKHGRRGTNGTDYGLYIWDKGLDGRNVGTARRWATELFIYEVDNETKA